MKKILFFVIIVLVLVACTAEKINFGQLQDRNGLLYLVNESKPFSGEVISYLNGRVEFEGTVENGLRQGKWVYYFPSGQKKSEGNFKEGLKDGTWSIFQVNGTPDAPQVYKYGRQLTSEGTFAETPQVTDTVIKGEVKAKDPATGSSSQGSTAKKEEKKQTVVVWERLRGGAIKYLDGIPYTGSAVKYQRNGLKELEGDFYHGKRTGKWVYYDRLGHVRDVRYY